MSEAVNFGALTGAFVASAREKLRYRADVGGMVVFLALLLFIFTRLWQSVAAGSGTVRGYTVPQLVLYLLVAELVTMSPGMVHVRINRDVRSGDLAVQLLRPVSYVHWELARAAGAAFVRAVALLLGGLAVIAVLVGLPPLDPRGVAFGLLVLVPGAIVVQCVGFLLVGLLAFWIEDSRPFFWIWQKACFILGGLMLPLDMYPDWLRRVTHWLPFEALLFGPARTVVAFEPARALEAGVRLAAWAVVMFGLLHVTYAVGRRRVQLNGG